MTEGRPRQDASVDAGLARRIARIVEETGHGFWDWNPDSDAAHLSDAFLAVIGLDRANAPVDTTGFEQLIHPEDRSRALPALLSRGDVPPDGEIVLRFRHRDGRWVLLSSPVFFECAADGERRFTGIVRLVEPEDRDRRALVASEARFRDLAENVPGAIYRYSLFPDGRDAVDYMSPQCESVWGVPAEVIEANAQALWDIVFEEDFPEMQRTMMVSADTLEAWEHVWRVRTPSGTDKWLHGRATPRRQEDGTIVWNGVILDVSEQYRLETELRENQTQLARAQQLEALGHVTGGVAHDFNNLLSVIMGNAELLSLGGSPEQVSESAEQILTAAMRGSELTRSLLSYARRAPLAPTAVEVTGTLRAALALYRRFVPETIEIESRIPDTSCWIRVDRASLENALLNLVINARDAMSDGGRLNIEVEISDGEHCTMEIRDTGYGIAEADLEHVFDPFWSTKDPASGTGLGLSMVQGFVAQSGGRVEVRSRLGEGTAFTMHFPLCAPGEPGPAAQADPEGNPIEGRAVLVLEDDPAVRRTLVRILESSGARVLEADSGAAALELLDGGTPADLAIIDAVLPGKLQGQDVALRLREQRPDCRILILSGYANPATSDTLTELSDSRLVKPVRKRELLRVVATLLS